MTLDAKVLENLLTYAERHNDGRNDGHLFQFKDGSFFFLADSDASAVPSNVAGLVEQLKSFEDFINEPPPYEDQRLVRDYRHELYSKWSPLCQMIMTALSARPHPNETLERAAKVADERRSAWLEAVESRKTGPIPLPTTHQSERAGEAISAHQSSSLESAVEFVAKMCWRSDPPNANNPFTIEERFSAIKYHPTIKKYGKDHP